jgi:hypothetical protein
MIAILAGAFYFRFSRRCGLTHEKLRAHFHVGVVNFRKDAHWTVTIPLQNTQKLSLRPQTKQRFTIIYEIGQWFCALIICANLKGNYSLAACRQKDFERKDLKNKGPAFKADFGTSCRQTQAFKARAS